MTGTEATGFEPDADPVSVIAGPWRDAAERGVEGRRLDLDVALALNPPGPPSAAVPPPDGLGGPGLVRETAGGSGALSEPQETVGRYRNAQGEIVTAVQWDGANGEQLRKWALRYFARIDPADRYGDPVVTATVFTPNEEWLPLHDGDWVVRDGPVQFRPVDAETFAADYTPVPDVWQVSRLGLTEAIRRCLDIPGYSLGSGPVVLADMILANLPEPAAGIPRADGMITVRSGDLADVLAMLPELPPEAERPEAVVRLVAAVEVTPWACGDGQ